MTPEQILRKLAAEGNLRTLPEVTTEGIYLYHDGRRYLNLSSNDYLGIAAGGYHRDFMKSVCGDGRFLLSNPSSRLITGNSGYGELEETLGSMYGRSALVLGSGYLANTGILPAITEKDDVILADKYVHASIIDGLRLGPAEWHRYAHNDMDHLESLIKKFRGAGRGSSSEGGSGGVAGRTGGTCGSGARAGSSAAGRRIYIVTESVFSMDGDTAPIRDIVRLKERYGCRIYLDEAHTFGVRGADGRGVAAGEGLDGECDFIVATLGKAAASQGAFVVTDTATRELLVNRMRTLIFSTALPPLSLMWSQHVVSLIPGMRRERENLRMLERTMGADSHIIPVMAGGNEAAIALSDKIREEGFWVMPIRYPTVPKGSARVRISLSAALPEAEITKLSGICGSKK